MCPSHILKHSRQGRKIDTFEYRAYHIKKLCVVDCLKNYLQRRLEKVNDNITQLLITHRKPYKATYIDTIRRWIKELFTSCGLFNFTPHSCRAASTSKADTLNIDLDIILQKACWKNENTFYNYYSKNIMDTSTTNTFNKLIT